MSRFTRPLLATLLLFAATSVRAENLLEGAQTLYLTGRYDEALEQFSVLSKEQPVAAALGVARCRAAVGKVDEAERGLAVAAQHHPQAASLLAERALLAFERGDYQAAQKLVDQTLEIDAQQLTARWLSAELHRVGGRIGEANKAYEWFIDYYNNTPAISDPAELRWVGLAAAQFARWNRNSGEFRFLVNELYPDALKRNKNYWPAHLESALLFMEKYNAAAALNELNAALAINPNAAELHAARGMLALQNYELSRASISIERALAINPRLRMAQQLQADLLMFNFHFDKAVQVLEAARKLNPADEETLGRLAAAYGAIDGLKDDSASTRMGGVIAEAVQRNAHCGRFFDSLAASLELMRKYPQAATYYREAQRRLPQLIGTSGKLGLICMRLGDEAQAAQLLKESFEIDPFNVRVKNSLEVLDVLQGYAVIESDHFVIKFDRGQDELLAHYTLRFLEDEVYPELVQKLGYEPREKLLFEIFSRARNTSGHGWFSARMVGLPFVGTVAACAGKVVAMVSPNDMPQRFNWARVLKHEFVHVMNLQQTDFNVSHWFTEALAVRNEGYPRPPLWSRILARRAAADQLFDLDTINIGFSRPASGEDWTLAYCQADLYAQYMIETYGDESLAKMLAAYADGLNTRDAIRRCFAVSQQQFESGYRQYVRRLVSNLALGQPQPARSLAELETAVKDDPRNADLWSEMAYAYLQKRMYPQAGQSAQAARKLAPRQPLAAYVLARLQLLIGNPQQAMQLLDESLDKGSPQPDVLGLLAALKLKASDFSAAEELYRLGADTFSDDEQWLKALARLYLESGQNDKLADPLARLAQYDPDSLTLRKKLTQLELDKQDFAAAARWANEALHIDVLDADVHAMLARALSGQGRHTDAIEQYETALRLDPRQAAWRLALATAYAESKQLDLAGKALQELLKTDPEFPGANELLEKLRS